jgi:hypothetical protein
MLNPSLSGVKRRALVWSASLCLLLALVGCERSMIVRVIRQGTDGTNEFWVCDGGAAQQCGGEQEGDIDPKGYQKRLQVLAPPAQCTHGTVATMDIVIEHGKVVRVRYECGLPATPTGLPPSSVLSPAAPQPPSTN